MSVNNMTFEQSAGLLNAIASQATGATNIAVTSPADFISVATTTLNAGVDPVLNAITQVIDKTIFSIRGYERKFKGLEADQRTWGSITRKLSIADTDFENSQAFNLVDGASIDPWKVKKPNILQTNFYGANTFTLEGYTITRKQLYNAFRNADEFGQFMNMLTQNIMDIREQNIESVARQLICNYIGGKITANNGVIHLITEYNADTGSSVTATTVYQDDNFNSFCRWLAGKIDILTSLMTERSGEYQIQVTGKTINRHTPLSTQRVYLYAPLFKQMKTRVYPDAFHDNYLDISETEGVNFWQSIKTPNGINVTPTYMQANGTVATAESAVNRNDVIGVIFDRDTMGYTIFDENTGMSPYNPRGEYWTVWHNFVQRWWSDYTEKGIVLVMD